MRSHLGIVLRGFLMGMAEVVPGVSGGTIALVTGIYSRLVAALASFGVQSFLLLKNPRAFIAHHDLGFLIALGLGMGLGVLSLASLVNSLLENYQSPLWAFFFGLILATAVGLGRERERSKLLIYGSLGAVGGFLMVLIPEAEESVSLLGFFFSGALAICAWILPAVSGSYLLVVLGYYKAVLAAIENFDIQVIIVFGAGCALGLLLFVRALKYLLAHHYEALISFLCGFMALSALKLWPWQLADTAGFEALTLPSSYAAISGNDPWLILSICCAMLGILFYLLLRQMDARSS